MAITVGSLIAGQRIATNPKGLLDQGRRVVEGSEELGTALMRLEEAMTELRGRYDLSVEDLDLDLGPLGTLL